MSMPGMILSQLGISTRASKAWASATVSTESAISSRLASEYFMPAWFMAMPSQTPMVVHSKGDAARHADACFDGIGDLPQVHVAGDRFVERVDDADEGFLELIIVQAQGAQQRTVRGALDALFDGVALHLHG